MKRFYYLTIMLLIIPLWIFAYASASKELVFDPKIASYLQKEFNTTDLSPKLIHSVKHLDLSNQNLTSTKGLEHFKNLEKLNLSHNIITDSSFLNELPYLTELDMSFNQLEHIESVNAKMENLNLQSNRLTSIEFTHSLEDLTTLNIRANDVLSLEPLEEVENLTYLNIRGNRVESLQPLSSLENLVNLNARNNQIQSIDPIIDLPLHERIFLSGNNINNFELLADKLDEIEEIDFEIDIPKPLLHAESGVYDRPFQLEIETDEDLEIYYTLDGSLPNANANKYEGPIEISREAMLEIPLISNHQTSSQEEALTFEPEEVKRAVTVTAVSSYKKGKSPAREFSKPVSATYILEPDLFSSSLPVISLTAEPRDLFDHYEGIYVPGIWYEEDSLWSGNYAKKGRAYEKEATIDFFHKDGQLKFHQNIGIRINGRASRRLPQKSLRIYPRSDYGQSRIYANIFKDLAYDEFNLLLLRNSGQDFNSTFLRDGLMHELIKDLDVDTQAYRPSIVLINGEYWGIHNIREKYDKDYIDIKYNVRDEDLVLMKAYTDKGLHFDMKSGSDIDRKHYDDLLDFVSSDAITADKGLEHVETLMDLDNFLHYVAYQVYYVNIDSFSNNLMLWRKRVDYTPEAPTGHDGRWRWMLFDLDWGMGRGLLTYKEDDPLNYNMIEHVLEDEERMTLFRELMKNKEVKERFIKTMITLLQTNFETDYVKQKIDEASNNIRDEMPQMIARWENISSIEEWEENLEELYEFAEKRPQVVKENMLKEFNLTELELEKIEKEVSLAR